MSRLGAAGAVAQLVADVPLSSVQVVEFEKMLTLLNFPKCFFFFFIVYLLSYGFDVIKGEALKEGPISKLGRIGQTMALNRK
jgi:hypothetical protein